MKLSVHAVFLIAGLALGAVGVRLLEPSPAAAQMTSPMPMSADQCSAMHSAMMSKMHSAADHAMMSSMMGMHEAMLHATMTGNADHDFLAMMIPHHQAAVQMAKAELQYGKDPKVRALAGRIISTQQQEIAEMTAWLRSMH